MVKKMNAFWDAKHKGFSTIVLLGLLSFVMACLSLSQIYIEQLMLLKQYNLVDEKIEIQIIKEIKQCYFKQNCENHETEVEGIHVEYIFNDLEARVLLGNGREYHFSYDEPFLCIASMDIYTP